MSKAQVGILMGSDSDLPIMEETAKILKKFDIRFEMHVMSAHRTPNQVVEYVTKATESGVKVFIAGAGGAAHLAGVVAAHTTCPVIGIPIEATSLKGLDALLSTVQMPPGIPVATVAVGKFGAINAALLAIQIIGTSCLETAKKLKDYKKEMAEKVTQKDKDLQKKYPKP
jgi:phosphoribosylaminoimidazole carboxylase PurE protein